MDELATVDTGTVLETQSTDTDSAPAEAAQTQAAPKAASTPSIKELLKREKEDANLRFTDAEQDVYDAYIEKQDAAKANPKAKVKTEPEPEVEDDEADAPEPKAKEKPEPEPEDEDPEPEEGDDSDTKAILKEVGAKSLKDAAAKIKELRKGLSGKDAQAVAKVTKERDDVVKQGRELWTALKNGDAGAKAFAEKTFGVKFADGQPQAPQSKAVSSSRFIDPAAFIDPESANQANAIFERQEAQIKALEDRFGTVEQERDARIQESQHKQSIMTVVDEMAQIAQYIPELKGISGFKEAAQAVLDGKPDPRLDVFQELFEIAGRIKGATLKDAFDIKRGRDSDRQVAQAKQDGRKEAYNQKPNPSLSGQTGGKGEASYQPVTPAQLEQWESDHTTHPDSWYDKEGDLIESKVPKSARKIFGLR